MLCSVASRFKWLNGLYNVYKVDVKYYYFYHYYLKVFFKYLCSLLFLHLLCAGYSSYSFSFLGETAKPSNNEVNNFKHVYCPLVATAQNDSSVCEPELRQAPVLTERVYLGLRRKAPSHLTRHIFVTDASFHDLSISGCVGLWLPSRMEQHENANHTQDVTYLRICQWLQKNVGSSESHPQSHI